MSILVPMDLLLGRYRVVKRIANGGHSIIYRGTDERLSRPVCIKLFTDVEGTEQVWRWAYEHFVQEAYALGKLTHPNTLRIFDVGHVPGELDGKTGSPFHVLEYMNGGTLSQRVRRDGPLTLADGLSIARALAGALAEAHELGLVHRDIKPNNILFGTGSAPLAPKLADFGIAKYLFHNTSGKWAEDTKVVAGHSVFFLSLPWAAPEQFTGKGIGPSADVYSLALLTAYMLSGNVAFKATSPQDAYEQRHQSDTLIQACLAGLDLPAEMLAVFLKACRFNPDERDLSPREFVDRLAEWSNPSRESQRSFKPAPVGFRDQTRTLPRALEAVLPLNLFHDGQQVGDRLGRLAPIQNGTALIERTPGGARIRATVLFASGKPVLQIKGMNCFVAREGGRPSPAVQIDSGGVFELLSPDRTVLDRAEVQFGVIDKNVIVFNMADHSVAIDANGCPQAVAVDFGPNLECWFLHEQCSDGDGARHPPQGVRTR